MATWALLMFTLFFSAAKGQLVPALYVFGDSTVDGGNSRTFNPLYGMDLNATIPPRPTNGMTIADFLAIFLGLPIVPPSKNLSLAGNSTTGVNYAFGGTGILPQTGNASWSFDAQIGYFNLTLANNLMKRFNQEEVVSHLKESIFLISFGINDYILYIDPNNSTLKALPPVAFANFLLNELAARLRTLYGFGARKFLVNSIWPMGCLPLYTNESEPFANFCNITVNELVLPYSNTLPLLLKELELTLPGSLFSHSNDFLFVTDLKEHTAIYGITNTTGRCLSEPFSGTPCKSRDHYLYFDEVHTTEAANRVFALHCFNGSLCTPLNVMLLACAKVY